MDRRCKKLLPTFGLLLMFLAVSTVNLTIASSSANQEHGFVATGFTVARNNPNLRWWSEETLGRVVLWIFTEFPNLVTIGGSARVHNELNLRPLLEESMRRFVLCILAVLTECVKTKVKGALDKFFGEGPQ